MDIKKYFSKENIRSAIDNVFKVKCSSTNKIIIFLLVVYISFNKYFEAVFDEKIVRNFICYFQDNAITRFIFVAVILYLLYSIFRSKINNYKISSLKIELSVIVLLFWVYYRFFCKFIYVDFGGYTCLYYIDLVAFWSISIIIRCCLYKKEKRLIDVQKGLEQDVPISDKSQDLLKRDPFAVSLAEKIINTKGDGAFSVGIVSQWGNGKTSFINLLCKHFDDKQNIIIKFNPWQYGKERNLIDAFFLQLSQNLKVYDSSLSTELREYSHILSSSNSTLLNIGAKLFENFTSKDIQERYKNIKKTIKNIGRLVIVIIDDLDRLDKNEILSVLKLIRNSANFPNMAFISAYDREYLTETLKDTVYKGNIYLDKIFQYEFKLPTFDKSKLKDLLYKKCVPFINEDEEKTLKEVIYDYDIYSIHTGFISDYLENVRDVERFINAFHTSYEKLKGEVLIKDLMNMELLRLKYPYVYDLLANTYYKYLTQKNGNWVFEKERADNKNKDSKENRLLVHIKNRYDEYDLKCIETILNTLFNNSVSSQVTIKAINNPDYIQRYFYYALSDYDISKDEFNSVIGKSYDDIKKKIDEWIINQSRSLTTLLINYSISNEEKYKKIIRSIFYLGKKSKAWTLSSDEIKAIINKTQMRDNTKKDFIKSVLFENDLSEFVVKFIHDIYLNEPHTWTFIISKDECKEICCSMFENACKNNENMATIYSFYEYTKYIEYTKNGNDSYISGYKHNEKADNLFFEYTKDFPRKVLPSLISKGPYNNNNTYSIGSWAIKIWNGKNSFIKFIESLPQDDNLISEFQDFMNKYFKGMKPIKYNFKYLFNDDYLDENSAKNK